MAVSIIDKDGLIQINNPPGAYGLEYLIDDGKRNTNGKGLFSEADSPCTIKLEFSNLGSIIEISREAPKFSFTRDDSIRDLLDFNLGTIYEKKLSNT